MANRSNTYYANTQAIHGYGAQLLVGTTTSPQTFQAIALIHSITPGEMSTAVINRTHLRSPEKHHEKMAGLRDSGPFTIEGTWAPTDESQSNAGGGTSAFASGGLVKLWRTRAERDFIIELGDGSPGTEWTFRGVITKFQPGEIGIEDKINFTCEITPLQDFSADLP